ncbi:hypothetical protein FHG87_025069 [Trinorchestia longiramus]|nr:hypothetical protein FHG87_025069 [Trinorchestia longiramus]
MEDINFWKQTFLVEGYSLHGFLTNMLNYVNTLTPKWYMGSNGTDTHRYKEREKERERKREREKEREREREREKERERERERERKRGRYIVDYISRFFPKKFLGQKFSALKNSLEIIFT